MRMRIVLAWDIGTSSSRLQDSDELKADREKFRKNHLGPGRSSGACKHCFNYLIPVYQLLTGQL